MHTLFMLTHRTHCTIPGGSRAWDYCSAICRNERAAPSPFVSSGVTQSDSTVLMGKAPHCAKMGCGNRPAARLPCTPIPELSPSLQSSVPDTSVSQTPTLSFPKGIHPLPPFPRARCSLQSSSLCVIYRVWMGWGNLKQKEIPVRHKTAPSTSLCL